MPSRLSPLDPEVAQGASHQATREQRGTHPVYCTCTDDDDSDDFVFLPPKPAEEHVWRPRIKRFVEHWILHEEEVNPPPVPEKDDKYLRRCMRCGLLIQHTSESHTPSPTTAQSPASTSSISPPPIPDKPLPKIPQPPSWPWAGMNQSPSFSPYLDEPVAPPSFPMPHHFNEEHPIFPTANGPEEGCSLCSPGQLDVSQDEYDSPHSPSRSDRFSVCDSPTTMVASPSMHQMLTKGSLPPTPTVASPIHASSPVATEFRSAAEEKRALTIRNPDEPEDEAGPPQPSSSINVGADAPPRPLSPPTSPPPAYTPWPAGHQETAAEIHEVYGDAAPEADALGYPLHRRLSGMPSLGSALDERRVIPSAATIDPSRSPVDVIQGLLRDVEAVAEEYHIPNNH